MKRPVVPEAPTEHHYEVYGVSVASDITLMLPPTKVPSVAFVQLSRGEPEDFSGPRAAAGPTPDGEWGQVAVLADRSLYMRWDDWLEFTVSADGRQIIYNPLCPGPPHSFEAYIANFAVSAAMVQQGEEPLHATVIDVQGSGIGLLGPSGTGKSTLAGHLIAQGGRLVTDDLLRITLDDVGAWAHPGPLRLKLNQDMAPEVGVGLHCRGEWSPDAGKFLFEPGDPEQPHDGVRLSALIWLEPPDEDNPATGIVLDRVTGLDLFRIVSASTMNSRVHSPDRLKRQMDFAARLGRVLPVYRLVYPRRTDVLDAVAHAIAEAGR